MIIGFRAGRAFNARLINSTVLSAHYHYLGYERWQQRCEGRDTDERGTPTSPNRTIAISLPLLLPVYREFIDSFSKFESDFKLIGASDSKVAEGSHSNSSHIESGETEYKTHENVCTLSTRSSREEFASQRRGRRRRLI